MSRNYTKVLLVSANVGSIFEDPEHMLKQWLSEFLATIKRLNPDFLAIHCQEVGGKNYEESMQHVNLFIKTILAREEMQQFDKARVFLDEDFTAVDKFTALGNLYFIHESVHNVQIFNFEEKIFVPVEGREVLSGNIEAVAIKEKSKFPQEFFPDFKWSRKGFLRTRWNICNTVFDLINLHLFHDANNIISMETTPSTYSMNRQRTLLYTINRFETDEFGQYPYFIFGDFNFRLDSKGLVKRLTQGSVVQQTKGKKNEVCKVVFKQNDNDTPLLTIEKKGFDHHHHHGDVFSNNNGHWLREYDAEPGAFKDKLHEYDIVFPPSYPFSEDVEDGVSYMKTRVPSWCDRIMMTPSCQEIIYQSKREPPEYNMIGSNICMGDHKPIYLNLKLRHSQSGNEGTPLEEVKAEGEPSPASPPACTQTVPPISPNLPDQPTHIHSRLQKVISINGEEVNASSLDDINIHDFSTFEREQYITRKFMSTIRRKNRGRGRTISAPADGFKEMDGEKEKKPGFRNVAKNIMRADNVLRAMKHYNHRSDSESESDDEDEAEAQTVESAPVIPSSLTAVTEASDSGSNGGTARNKVTSLSGFVFPLSSNMSQSDNNNEVVVTDKSPLATDKQSVTVDEMPGTVDQPAAEANTNNNNSVSHQTSAPNEIDVALHEENACSPPTDKTRPRRVSTLSTGQLVGGKLGWDCWCCVVQ